jgi:hypothetical protein
MRRRLRLAPSRLARRSVVQHTRRALAPYEAAAASIGPPALEPRRIARRTRRHRRRSAQRGIP